jgi:hypothetical protein
MSRSEDEPFLSRWARRKRDAARPIQVDDAARVPQAGPDLAVHGTATQAQPPALADALTGASAPPGAETAKGPTDRDQPLDLDTLPKVDELTVESDITAFLDKRVPALLRNAALSRMWSLDPTIRDFIEVAENQWNWNIPGGAPFYEEMLPGSAGNTLIADATSAISRLASDPVKVAEPGPSLADASDQAPKPAPVEPLANPAAMPPEISSETSVAQEQIAPRLAQREPAAAIPDAVQDHAAAQPARRRHGGALPV